ncbi:MAG: hypothetical protein J5963_08170, partial [Schwartzia sp.]|nr:hypothetical protein [Schwartzia sp. (in: firmicutes)]
YLPYDRGIDFREKNLDARKIPSSVNKQKIVRIGFHGMDFLYLVCATTWLVQRFPLQFLERRIDPWSI